MIHWEETPPVDEQKKWSEWSMRAGKAKKMTKPSQRQLGNLASAFVLALSAVVVSGLPQHLLV
jgi:hypothetical protein